MAYHSLKTLSNTDATLVSPNGVHSGTDITIQNVNSSGYIYIGGSTVSEDDYGYRILPNHAISVELSGQSSLYAIASVAGMNAAILNANLESGS
jgi:hypothetical protein